MPHWIAADNSEIRSHLITIITTLLCPASIVALMLALTIESGDWRQIAMRQLKIKGRLK